MSRNQKTTNLQTPQMSSDKPITPLLHLCPEITITIAGKLQSLGDIARLCRAHSGLRGVLAPYLYRRDIRDHHGSALFWAAAHGNVKAARKSLRYGAATFLEGAQPGGHETALMMAADAKSPEMVRLLLDHGAPAESRPVLDPCFQNVRSALQRAVNHGDLASAKMLIDAGARLSGVQTPRDPDPSCLRWALKRGHKAVAMLLIEKGAYLNVVTDAGKSMLHVAVSMESVAVATCLLKRGLDANKTGGSSSEDSLLMVAAKTGSKDMVELLLQYGANLQFRTRRATPLSRAIESGNAALIKHLVAEYTAYDTGTVPDDPLSWDEDHLFQWFANRRMRCDMAHTKIQNLLSLAAENGSTAIVSLLIARGASLGRHNCSGMTPLMMAARGARPKVISLLLEGGAQLETNDQVGRTALCLAVTSKGATEDVHESIQLLLKAGANPDIVPYRGNPLLSQVAYGTRLDIAKMLLAAGATVDLCNDQGRTSLSLAAQRGNVKVVRFLRRHGANPKSVCDEGKTPRDWALHRGKKILKVLK
ncbi:ankyrin repeat protein [Purpureocillium lavendulum]|uniref:Ankyrin repeat protein n=1 Tax=Purpureocillium lavendulum TaxID=1247861 RepID=A0AB34FKK5_9HYPO|nr:ankyrin repeat protein [Purpureocillium lavendulum]